jgi:hypothetical protein
VWKGPGVQDSSDEEWEDDSRRRVSPLQLEIDSQVNTQDMVDNVFLEEPLPTEVEDIMADVVTCAFALGDSIHEECGDESLHDGGSTLPSYGRSEHSDYDTGDLVADEEDNTSNLDATLLEDAIHELYSGARCTKLAAIILLQNLYTVHGVSNNFTDELFTILHRHLLPEGNILPKNHYAAKSLTSTLGLSYNSIHACGKRCVLFRGEYADAERCPKCDGPRFSDADRKKYPVKVLRHFPIIPRLQRMFRSPAISSLMKWHEKNRSDREGGDGLRRHPCDSKAWKHFHNNVDPSFADDARNIHFTLAADGVNPFKQTRSTWSTWPVTLLNYNLPPWLCTKKFFLMICLLLPGKQLVTSECFDVYMAPLVEELLELWHGIPVFDITQEEGLRNFTL